MGRERDSPGCFAAAAWAEQHNLAALTLTTYSEVPWNAPYYERLGFQIMAEDQLNEGLRRIREHEAARGLARWLRVTMRRPVGRQGLSHSGNLFADAHCCLVPPR